MAADIDAVIGVFSAQRLLVLGEDSVEIAHDALLHAWRLATVDTAAARWQGAPARYLPLPATSQAFLGAAHHAASRGTLRRRAVIAGLLALTVIAVSAAGIAVNAATDASRQAANASRQHAIALSRELAAESLAADSANPLTARRLAVAAWRVFPTGQAGSALASLLMEQQQRGILHGNPANAGVRVVSFSPDGKLLAASYGDGTVRLWNPATQQAVGAPFPAATGPGGSVLSMAFSPDGRLLASAGADGTVRTWPMPLFADPYAALCADVGPPTKAEWTHYAPGELQPSVCR
jgi:hypothetical protein